MRNAMKMIAAAVIACGMLCACAAQNEISETPPPEYIPQENTQETAPTETEEPSPPPAEEPEDTFTPYYPLTDEDRDLVERVVTAESVGQPFEGQMAVAQCILNTAIARDMTPGEVVTAPNQYAAPADPAWVTASVQEAVSFVFDYGRFVTEEPIRYFYAPALCESAWHESLEHVDTIADHKFFKLPD